MRIWHRMVAVASLLAACVSLLGCTTGKPLPASWPRIGLTLPGSAKVKKLHQAFKSYTKDGVYAHLDDSKAEVWAVCFSCPGGITQADVHVDAELKRHGFTSTTGADFPFTYAGGITGYYGTTYLWVSKDKHFGVSLTFLDDLSSKAKEKTGDLCLMIMKEHPDQDLPVQQRGASRGLF